MNIKNKSSVGVNLLDNEFVIDEMIASKEKINGEKLIHKFLIGLMLLVILVLIYFLQEKIANYYLNIELFRSGEDMFLKESQKSVYILILPFIFSIIIFFWSIYSLLNLYKYPAPKYTFTNYRIIIEIYNQVESYHWDLFKQDYTQENLDALKFDLKLGKFKQSNKHKKVHIFNHEMLSLTFLDYNKKVEDLLKNRLNNIKYDVL